jgi:hypothetical protein
MAKASVAEKRGVQRRLEEELRRLKAKFGLAGNLGVVWSPKPSHGEDRGMASGSTILVFDSDEEAAVKTLRHEYIEYVLIHEFLEPLLFEAKLHRRADALVDIIASLV